MTRTSAGPKPAMQRNILGYSVKRWLMPTKSGQPARPKLHTHTAKYLADLAEGWQSVLCFLASVDVSCASLGYSGSRWDRVLHQFVKEMYRRGMARGAVVLAVLGTARRRRLRR